MRLFILLLCMPYYAFGNQVDLNVDNWMHIPYESYRAHNIYNKNNSLTIEVRESAGFFATPITEVQKIKELHIKGSFVGSLTLEDKQQGSKNADDFILRVGLILSGENRLNWLQKRIAPDWVKQAYKLAGDKNNSGIDKILFYNFYSDKTFAGVHRVHPRFKLIEEIFAAEITSKFEYSIEIDNESEVLGFWISSDGDDTNSNFDLTIDSFYYR